jgi:predicted DNA-binding ribbon-helix-helix protein
MSQLNLKSSLSEQVSYLSEIQDQSLRGKSSLISRNITILGKRTSVRLEPEMWQALKDVAKREGCSIHDICSLIFIRKRDISSLTASIRVFLMLYYKASSTEEGHRKAGHGCFIRMKQRAKIQDNLKDLKRGLSDQSQDDFINDAEATDTEDPKHGLWQDIFAGGV